MQLQWKSFPIDLVSFHDFLKINIVNADGINTTETGFEVVEKLPLSPSELTMITDYMNNLTEINEVTKINQRNQVAYYSKLIGNAIAFGESLKIQFAAENVAMGITQAGKTKAVADYLSILNRYISSGSLYEVINSVDNLIEAGIPSELNPFVTVARLESFKSKVRTYLGI